MYWSWIKYTIVRSRTGLNARIISTDNYVYSLVESGIDARSPRLHSSTVPKGVFHHTYTVSVYTRYARREDGGRDIITVGVFAGLWPNENERSVKEKKYSVPRKFRREGRGAFRFCRQRVFVDAIFSNDTGRRPGTRGNGVDGNAKRSFQPKPVRKRCILSRRVSTHEP